jgi:hypothetical protein
MTLEGENGTTSVTGVLKLFDCILLCPVLSCHLLKACSASSYGKKVYFLIRWGIFKIFIRDELHYITSMLTETPTLEILCRETCVSAFLLY